MSTETPAGNTPAPIEGLPANFKSVADLAASYAQLQGEFTRVKQAQTTTAPPAAPKTAQGGLRLADTPAASPLDFNQLREEFNANGFDLTAETRQRLVGQGYSSDLIDSVVSGWQAKMTNQTRAAADLLGGEAELQRVLQFGSNLPPAQKNAFNAALDTPAWEAALLGLKSIMDRQTGTPPVASTGEPGKTPGVVSGNKYAPIGFANTDSLIAATRDPRYKSDPTYRSGVEAQMRQFYGRA